MAEPRSAQDVLGFLAQKRSARSATSVDELRKDLYRQAAAVLAAIQDPENLQPIGGGGQRGEGQRLLSTELIPVLGKKFNGVLMLHPDARRRGLANLSSVNQRLKALESNPRERTGALQTQLERYLLGSPIPLSDQTADELDETRQIVTWFEGLVPGLPPLADIQARLSERELITDFEALAGDAVFRGRRKEIDSLRSYIGVLEPAALLQRLTNRALRWHRPEAMPALSVSGPGGVGKSALVARFLLEHFRLPFEARLPFAYLDFDRPSLNISEPSTLLAEMLRQIDQQFSKEGHFRKLREFFEKQLGHGDAMADSKGHEDSVWSVIADLAGMIDKFLGPRPYVLVLDTFEEVQFRGEERAFPFWELLDRFQRARPFLRVVLSGRAPVTSLVLAGKPPEQIILGELDHEAAVAYMESQGVTPRSLAEALVRQIGGIPLSLKLAASVVKREGANSSGVRDLSGKSRFWFSTSDEVIQGQLYSRILGHLHDPALNRLAHPGLVLRRISPQVILYVLNEPCELGISTMEQAVRLFESLKMETSLVYSDSLDSSLIHRPELRRTMLKLMMENSPAATTKIHRKAAEYYGTQVGSRAKAEELYHRLQLRDMFDDQEFESLRLPDIKTSIQNSIAELPVASQRLLAQHGYQVSKEILANASQEEQEASLAAQAEESLPFGKPAVEHARLLVDQVAARLGHASPLYRSAARIAAQQGRDENAWQFTEEGLRRALEQRDSELALQLLGEQAWLLRKNPSFGSLPEKLDQFGEYAKRFDRPIAMLQHRLQCLELVPQGEMPPNQLRTQIGLLMNRITPEGLWAIFPTLERTITQLEPETSLHIWRLMMDMEGPFRRVENRTIQETLALGGEQFSAEQISRQVLEICELWPYRVLNVQPPYSSGSYRTEDLR